MPRRILVLEPPGGELRPLEQAFAEVCGAESVIAVATRGALLELLPGCDLVVLDRELGDGEVDGREIVGELRARDALMPVVLVAEHGDVGAAAEAIASGASDFLVRREQLFERVETLIRKVKNWLRLLDRNRALEVENERLREAVSERWAMVGRSPQLTALLRRVERVARVPRPVLILGERGTGKELIARALHDLSGATGPFVVVNCAAITDSLLEGELFGHEKGAFTGADRRAAGKFEVASEGTLFLDEIGHMSLAFQQKILRAVEYGTFLRVGATEETRVSTRIVAATNADLRERIRRGEFLADLYDRLSFEELKVPPLREREGDVEVLARHFLAQFVREVPGFRAKRIAQSALARLAKHAFPGNVRELKNVIERAVYRETGDELTADDLGLEPEEEARAVVAVRGSFKARVAELERALIEGALSEAGGNQAEAARRLGLSYHQFRYFRTKHQ